MVLAAFALFGTFLPPAVDIAEYQFKNAKAAYFLHTQWQTLKVLYPNIQIATDREHPPQTGSWVYVDQKRNALVFGSRDDSAKDMASILAQFDIAARKVRLGLAIERVDWGLENHATIEASNNESILFGTENLGATLTVRPRINPDASITVYIVLHDQQGVNTMSCVGRLNPLGNGTLEISGGKAALLKEAPPIQGEGFTTLPTGPGWNPFVIRISARVVDNEKPKN